MTRYHGVVETVDGNWDAVIFKSGKPIFLGRFEIPEMAAKVWDMAMLAACGDFASGVLNFPEEYDALTS